MMTEQIWLEMLAADEEAQAEEAQKQYEAYLLEQAAEEEAQQGNE